MPVWLVDFLQTVLEEHLSLNSVQSNRRKTSGTCISNWSKSYSTERGDREWVSADEEHSSRDSGAGAVNRLMDGWESFSEQLLSIKFHKEPIWWWVNIFCTAHTATQRTIWTVQITDMMIKRARERERESERASERERERARRARERDRHDLLGLARKASELLLWLILQHFYYRHELCVIAFVVLNWQINPI